MEHNRGVTTLHPWEKGMCNKSSANTLPDETVANAVNVDFGTGRRIARRRGIGTKVYSGLSLKDSYSCEAGVFFIEGPTLRQFNADNTSTILYTGVTGSEFAFDYLNAVTYFSDGTISLKIVSGVASAWGMSVPNAPVMYGTSGTYDAGVYLAAVCWVDANGVESGASVITALTVSDSSGIAFSNLPSPVGVSPAYLRLYLSMPNGSELYHIADVSPGTESYTLSAGRYDNANVLTNRFVSPAPPGRIIRHYNGQIYIADSSGYVWYTEPLEPDHFKLSSNYLYFPDQADVMEPVKNGIFFAYGNVTEFHAGNVEEGFDIAQRAEYGGIYGTGRVMPHKRGETPSVCWQSDQGTIIGSPDGQIDNIVEEFVAPGTGDTGNSFVREENGIRQFVVKINDPTTSRIAARSWIDAEVIRKGA